MNFYEFHILSYRDQNISKYLICIAFYKLSIVAGQTTKLFKVYIKLLRCQNIKLSNSVKFLLTVIAFGIERVEQFSVWAEAAELFGFRVQDDTGGAHG